MCRGSSGGGGLSQAGCDWWAGRGGVQCVSVGGVCRGVYGVLQVLVVGGGAWGCGVGVWSRWGWSVGVVGGGFGLGGSAGSCCFEEAGVSELSGVGWRVELLSMAGLGPKS